MHSQQISVYREKNTGLGNGAVPAWAVSFSKRLVMGAGRIGAKSDGTAQRASSKRLTCAIGCKCECWVTPFVGWMSHCHDTRLPTQRSCFHLRPCPSHRTNDTSLLSTLYHFCETTHATSRANRMTRLVVALEVLSKKHVGSQNIITAEYRSVGS